VPLASKAVANECRNVRNVTGFAAGHPS